MDPARRPAARAALGAYRRERGFDTYDELWRWSVTDLEGFWGSIWDRYGVGERGETVLASREMPGAQWFPGTLVNYAEHAFRGRDDDALAIVAGGEDREDAEWTWGELRALTRRIAAGLRALGVERGDRVVAYMPNIPETAAAFLACASLGAVWSSLLAGLRPAQRDRPLRADRAEGAAGGAPVPLQRARVRPLARRSTRSSTRCRGCSTTAVLGEDELGRR